MLPLLKKLITQNPFVDEVDFSNEGITSLDPHSVETLGKFTELRKVSTFGKTTHDDDLI